MNISIGAEYIIANALIALNNRKDGLGRVSFEKIREIGDGVQQSCNENGIDVIVDSFGKDIVEAVVGFSKYFEFTHPISEGAAPLIKLNNRMNLDSLKQRFINYLPPDINEIIATETEKVLG